MLPVKVSTPCRVVRSFELIGPDGRVHVFPRPARARFIPRSMQKDIETVVLFLAVAAMLVSAGFLAEMLQHSPLGGCAVSAPGDTLS